MSAAGERRELERRRRLGLAQHRVALGRRLRVELAEDLAQLDGQADHRLVLRLALGVDAVEERFARQRHAARGRASTRGSRRRADPSTAPGPGTAGSGGRRRRPAARAPCASGWPASSGTRRPRCGSADRPRGPYHGSSSDHTRSGSSKSDGCSSGSSMNSQRRCRGPLCTIVVGRLGSHHWLAIGRCASAPCRAARRRRPASAPGSRDRGG